jgi:integrase
MAVRLTVPFVENAKAEEKRREIGDAIVPGLWLVVQPSGAKSWATRYRVGGKPIKVTLGPYPLLGLADAREQAREVLEKVGKGEDPAREKRETRTIQFSPAITSPNRDQWEQVRDDYLKRDALGLRSFDQIERLLKKETAGWNGRKIQDIGRRDVVELLDAITDRGAPIQANRVLALVRRLFNWAIGRGVLTSNPTEGVEAPGQERSRDRVLAPNEIADLWEVAGDLGFPFGSLVRLLLVSGQRLREVAEARWDEINLDDAMWTIGADRAKNGERHEVPLSAAAVDIFRSLPRIGKSPFALTTTGASPISGFARAKERIDAALRTLDLQRAGPHVNPDDVPTRAHWTFHDIRRSVATNMAGDGALIEVIERVLNHRGFSGSGLRAVYNRHSYLEEKRRALDTWAVRLGVITSRGGNVVSLAGRGR